MELYELKYFLGVAHHENIHRASEDLNVSAASLSKAIARLEEDLGVNLFVRDRRNIRLTDEGRRLQRRAADMVRLEEELRLELIGSAGALRVRMSGPEILLSKMGMELSLKIKKRFPKAQFDFHHCTDSEALQSVDRGESHLALITSDVGALTGLTTKVLEEAKFQTYVGDGHPLFAAAKANKTLPVDEVLLHSFASPDIPFLGKVGAKQSLDGWRDDQFPRTIGYLTSSLKLLEELVAKGLAVAYLPAYFCEGLPVQMLKISGCPYSCTQKIKLVAKNPKDLSWLNLLF